MVHTHPMTQFLPNPSLTMYALVASPRSAHEFLQLKGDVRLPFSLAFPILLSGSLGGPFLLPLLPYTSFKEFFPVSGFSF